MQKNDRYLICIDLWKELKKHDFNNVMSKVDDNGATIIFGKGKKATKVKIMDWQMQSLRLTELTNIVINKFRMNKSDRRFTTKIYGLGI